MIPTIIILLGALYWLLRETDYLRVRLLVGEPIDLGKLWIDTFVPLVGLRTLKYGLSEHEHIASWRDNPVGYVIRQSLNGKARTNGHYEILVSPCVEDVLCGKKWVDKHWNDLADYKPEVFMAIGGVRYNMTIKKPEIIKDVMRVNHLSKKQKLAYAQ